MSRSIDYGNLMHRAMRGLIQQVLEGVAADGLPGAHHFFITFDTTHPEAELADWLRDRYPLEMTVVMQHWYDDLQVTDAGFGVTLNFGDSPERLFVPFDALRTFVDPSVEFGLRFETQDSGEDEEDDADITELPIPPDAEAQPETAQDETEDATDRAEGKDAEIVSLDSFRK
ncbi:SspB family protein [Pseudooceanicola aestuarii]|uniref:SspB family protein n=1 Tax=Pseudooceanicola aestuarii TaxID=2697319 RepID=UPI0013D209DB|nr:ClpXP protease specificity-enhancing factor SspB [Pseudooceanicola aestuarii]